MKSAPLNLLADRRGRQFLYGRAVLASLLCGGLVLAPAWAGSKDDHEQARAAVQAGKILPLPTVLERLQQVHPGQVLELELEQEGGRWIYEVKLLQSDGKLLKLELDAATAQVLKVKRKDAVAPAPPATAKTKP